MYVFFILMREGYEDLGERMGMGGWGGGGG